jgi:hypothetical protein
MHAVTLRIRVTDDRALALLTDSLGELARELEHTQSEGRTDLGLVPDQDDPGRYWWEIVTESYA